MYLRSDLACDRKKDLECETIESISVEIAINDKKWLISGLYRPQTITDNVFSNDFIRTYDKISVRYDHIMFIGDLNYDLLTADRCTPLQNVCDVCDLENIIKGPTCFTKGASPTLNDVILTNSKNLLQNITNFNCGLSDVHNSISAQIKSNIPPIKEQFKEYRSYKQLNEEEFIKDLNQANISNKIDQENDINAAYNYFQTKVTTVIDQHIPMKKRKNRQKQAPFMNNQLQHAI